MVKKKMGGLGKLSQFSGIKSADSQQSTVISEQSAVDSENLSSENVARLPVTNDKGLTTNDELVRVKVEKKTNDKENLVTVNIKITKAQKNWLMNTATSVRENNTEPVPPLMRVYPQHLIGVAIDLLESVDVDWGEIKNVEDLREQLNI